MNIQIGLFYTPFPPRAISLGFCLLGKISWQAFSIAALFDFMILTTPSISLQCCRKIMYVSLVIGKWKYALTLGVGSLEVSDFEVSYEYCILRTATCPISIEPEQFYVKLKEPQVKDRVKLLNEKYKGVKLMVSINRLDYIKGILL
jgi:hypothetical protein